MAWFYGFGPGDVNALTMYQLQGYMCQISKIHGMINGIGEADEKPPPTDEELIEEARILGLIVPESG